jgi:two-component system, OmpR family, sensor kinase
VTSRLYLKLYLTFLGVAALALVSAGVAAHHLREGGPTGVRFLGPLARAVVRDPPSQPTDLRQRMHELADELGLDVVVWDHRGRPVVQAIREPLPPPSRWRRGWHRGGTFVIPLDGNRYLGVRERGPHHNPGAVFLTVLLVVAAVMAAGLYPLSRGITRRLEHLADGARRWGVGELGHRVPVEGTDEVATVASRFNQAAAAIESLVDQQRQMLANASHELRSPLARLRMAFELCAEEADPERRRHLVEKAHADIVDLDALVEEVLLSARAQPGVPRRPLEDIDLVALVRAEAERLGAEVVAEPATLRADATLLRHLVRNLLSNARFHGGAPVRALVERRADSVVLAVEDSGPGVPEAEREKIFAPFYRPAGSRRGSPQEGGGGVGLGLALVRQIARYHGGEVRYQARPQGGSRFEVTFPRGGSPPEI